MTTVNDIEELFRNNFRALFIFANRLVRDAEVARDIVHDVFASLLTDSPDEISVAYLYKGVRYACLNHIRKMSARERLKNLYSLETENYDENAGWPDEEDIRYLESIIETELTDQCRHVVRLRFTDRLTYREIALNMNISEVMVYKYLRHALNVLRQKFNEYE